MTMNTTLKIAALLVGCAGLMNGCGKQEPPPAQTAQQSGQPAPPQMAPAVVAAPTENQAAQPAIPTPPPPTPAPAVSAAPTPLALAAKNGCVACHATDKKLVGPAYQDVAKKYSAADEAKLIAKVKAGGAGVWGKIPMPPHPQVKDEDLKQLVQWILAGAK